MTRKRFWIFLTVAFSVPLLLPLAYWVFKPPPLGKAFYWIFGLIWAAGMIAIIWRRRWSGLWTQLPMLGVVVPLVWHPKGWGVEGVILVTASTAVLIWRFAISAKRLRRLSGPDRQKA